MGPYNRLNAYLRAQRDKVFSLGRHDCFTFTNGAFRELYGDGYADDWIGKYADLKPKAFYAAMRDQFGTEDLTEALDKRLSRHGDVTKKGSIVISDCAKRYYTGFALGISVGTKAAFVSDRGLVYLPVSKVKGAWSCRR